MNHPRDHHSNGGHVTDDLKILFRRFLNTCGQGKSALYTTDFYGRKWDLPTFSKYFPTLLLLSKGFAGNKTVGEVYSEKNYSP